MVAREEVLRQSGRNPFYEYMLPAAVLKFKQGFGRLIRSTEDYGVVAILDSRLLKSSYGKTIISSLPDVKMSNSLEDVQKFFESIPTNHDVHNSGSGTVKGEYADVQSL